MESEKCLADSTMLSFVGPVAATRRGTKDTIINAPATPNIIIEKWPFSDTHDTQQKQGFTESRDSQRAALTGTVQIHTMAACELAARGDVDGLRALPRESLSALDSHGSEAVHWAASGGHVHALAFLIEEGGCDAESRGLVSSRTGRRGEKRRRPLHWAARNGELEAVRYLIEHARVDPDARDRQSVSPLQLACWQNQFAVVRYLVLHAGVDAAQVNNYDCGLQHWIGTAPRERAGLHGDDLLPLARWLKNERGLDFHATQGGGHPPLHKAAYGGHVALCRWLRDECGACDDVQDHGGNYAADVAEMAGNSEIAEWLRKGRRVCAPRRCR